MKTSRWYFAANGNGYGPFTFQQLEQLAQTKMIGPSDFVWQQGDTETRHVNDVDELLHEIAQAKPHSRSHRSVGLGFAAVLVLGGFLAFYFFGNKFLNNNHVAENANPQLTDQESSTEIAVTSLPSEPSLQPPSQEADSKQTDDVHNAIASSELSQPDSKDSLRSNRTVTPAIEERDEPGRLRTASATTVAGNVALSSNGTVAVGAYRDEENMLDGKLDRKYAKLSINKPCLIILDKAYQLSTIRFKVVDVGRRYYQYILEVSSDGRSYETIADRRKGQHRGWQTHNFTARPVGFIRLKGTNVSDGDSFYLHEFEAYCHSPASPKRTSAIGQQERKQEAVTQKNSETERRRKMVEKRIRDAIPK
jgi:hypothetical protein